MEALRKKCTEYAWSNDEGINKMSVIKLIVEAQKMKKIRGAQIDFVEM